MTGCHPLERGTKGCSQFNKNILYRFGNTTGSVTIIIYITAGNFYSRFAGLKLHLTKTKTTTNPPFLFRFGTGHLPVLPN